MGSKKSKVHPDFADLLTEIDHFLNVTGMGHSYFGKVATGNSELVRRLRSGSEIMRGTERKVRAYIADQKAIRPEFKDICSSKPEAPE